MRCMRLTWPVRGARTQTRRMVHIDPALRGLPQRFFQWYSWAGANLVREETGRTGSAERDDKGDA